MVTTSAKNDDDYAVVPVVTQDVVNDDKDEPSVSRLVLFSHDLVDFDSTEEFVSLGQDLVDFPVATDCTLVALNVDTDEQVIKTKTFHREKEKAASSEIKQLKRRIRTLEEKVDSLLLKKSRSELQAKELKTKLRAAEKSKKTLQGINDVLFKARIDLKITVAVEKDKVSDANSRITSLKKKNAKMTKKALVDEEIAP